nr:family 20 glycosylhydrolase [Phytoactinopolyspora alkaliphila]
MDLADWRRFVDAMGQLKLNTIGVSLYGCWDMHHGERSEYLFAPLDDYPALMTPRRLWTWDPKAEREVEHCDLPLMFEHDFFGDVVRHANRQGIEIVPHLGGPGHSTLLPRLIPALSALDDDGRPTGYGYCVTGDAAREALARLVRSLAGQHLLPNRIARLHVAGDEYYPIRNVDPADARRVVSPYCRCSGCRDLTAGQMLMEYLIHVGQVLDEYGITMVHWQDTLVREGVLDEYLDRVEARSLARPVIAWWKYNDPVPAPDTSRAEAWSCPITGFAPFLFHQDFTPNIETVLRRGHAAGATGVFGYGQPDPSFHLNYAFLADQAWNVDGGGGAEEFLRRLAARLCPEQPEAARYAFSSARTITASYPLMMYVMQHVLPFFSTAAAGATSYPDDLLRAFAIAQPPLADVLRQVADTLRDAVAGMPSGREIRHWPNPVRTWTQENLRIADTADLLLQALVVARAPEPPAAHVVEELDRAGKALLRSVAAVKPGYSAPAALREHWIFVRELHTALNRLRESGGVAGAESWYAWIV